MIVAILLALSITTAASAVAGDALLGTSVAGDLRADDVTLRLEVNKGGDLRWKNQPCTAVVTDKDGKVSEFDDAAEFTIAKGNVDVVVSCVANEGTLKKSLKINASKDQTIKVPFDPGFLTATIEREGRVSVGQVVVYDDSDHELLRGRDRTVLPVLAGNVRVLAIIDKATANTTRDIRGEARTKINANQKTELKLDASDGELQVTVTENGRPAKALVALREPGSNNRTVEITPGDVVSVPAGTWDLVSQLEDAHDFREQLTKGVVITPKKKTTKAINHTTGKLVAVVDLPTKTDEAGKKVQDAAGYVVDLLLPGAEQAFNQIDPNSEARLTPGKYVVRCTKDAVLDDGTKPVATSTTTVSGGSTSRVTVNPQVAHVDVDVRVGGEPRPLPVELTLPGASAALVSRVADAKGMAAFDVAPQTVTLSTTLTTPHGTLTQKKQLALKSGQNRVRLDIDVGTVVVQVIDAGTAVAGDIAYYTRLKKGVPDGEPTLTVKAGEEAYLPPGIYTLAVKRKAEQKLFGEVKVASGRVVERSVDWTPPPSPEELKKQAQEKEAQQKAEEAKKAEEEKAKNDASKKEGKKKDEPKKEEKKDAPKKEETKDEKKSTNSKKDETKG